MTNRRSIGEENAKLLADTKWWETCTNFPQAALIGLTIMELTMPMSFLRYALEQSFGGNVSEVEVLGHTEEILQALRNKYKVRLTPEEVVALVWPILDRSDGAYR